MLKANSIKTEYSTNHLNVDFDAMFDYNNGFSELLINVLKLVE